VCRGLTRCEREAPDCSCDGSHGYSLPHNHGVGSQVDRPRKRETTAQEWKRWGKWWWVGGAEDGGTGVLQVAEQRGHSNGKLQITGTVKSKTQ
jgi:hypothetical protein